MMYLPSNEEEWNTATSNKMDGVLETYFWIEKSSHENYIYSMKPFTKLKHKQN